MGISPQRLSDLTVDLAFNDARVVGDAVPLKILLGKVSSLSYMFTLVWVQETGAGRGLM